MYIYIYIYIYIRNLVVVLSLAKTLVVNEQKIFCFPECSMNKFRAYISNIYTYICNIYR